MEATYKITPENIKKISKKFEVLANKRHLRIIILLEEGEKTNDQVYQILKKEGIYKHRTNTYRALEKLVKQGIIGKRYDEKKKKFYYHIK